MAQEGRKVKPIPATTPSHFTERKTSRTNLTGLKPAKDFFFFSLSLCFFFPPFPLNSFSLSVLPSFLIPSSFHPLLFYSFFLPSFIYFFILFLLKFLLLIFPPIFFMHSSFLPSIPFLLAFSILPFSFIFSFFLLFPQVRQ